MGRPGVLVHIGYHKTGTTWLQQRLFVTAPLASPFRRRDIGHDFVSVNAFLFDAQVLAEKYAAAFRPVLATGDVPVLSHERLSGNPHSGGYDSRSIADRLRATCPDARILIVIREQRAMLQSVYKQYVHEGGPMSCEQYTTPPREGSMRVPLYRPEFFEYHHLIAYYQQLFSRDEVLVLPYEQLRAEPDAFIAAIGRNLGVCMPVVSRERLNPSSSALAVSLKRRANRFLVRDTLNPAALLERGGLNSHLARWTDRAAAMSPAPLRSRVDRRLRESIASAVRGRYAESNARTVELTALDLRRWGYDLLGDPS